MPFPSLHRLFCTALYLPALPLLLAVSSPTAIAEPIPSLHVQGSMHGFLLLKSADGKVIGTGDQISVAKGNQVRSKLTFHFRDGSIDEETTVLKQGSVFQLVSDHHVQKGPSFPDPLDLTVNVPS